MGAVRILVVRAGALGDTLMATPVVRALSKTHPGSEIDFLCSASAAPLVELHPEIVEVFPLRLRNLPYALSLEKHRLAAEISAREHAFAIVLERAPRYRALVERAGITSIRSFDETPFDPSLHSIENNLNAAGVRGALDMELHVSENDERAASALLADLPKPVVGLHLGYGPRHKKRDQSHRLKGWALDNFVALAEQLVADGVSVVVTGSEEDRADASALARLASVRDVAGRTSVRELGALIGALDLFVSVDSGPAHMAAAMGTSLIVLWGPAILEQVRPMSSVSEVEVMRHPVPCAPCYDTPLMKTCRQNICMEGITPAAVHRAICGKLGIDPV